MAQTQTLLSLMAALSVACQDQVTAEVYNQNNGFYLHAHESTTFAPQRSVCNNQNDKQNTSLNTLQPETLEDWSQKITTCKCLKVSTIPVC